MPSLTATDFLALGYKSQVPVIPPDAEISRNSLLFKRVGTSQDGRGKTPGIKGRDGKWFSFDWVPYQADDADIARWAKMGAGVGLKCGPQPDGSFLVGIDADAPREDDARTVLALVEKHFGRVPVRVGAHPKALFPLRVSAPLTYSRVDFGPLTDKGARAYRVEVLAEGRHFVAAGTHPKTGKPYSWPRDGVPKFEALPIVAPEQIAAFLEDVRKALPDAGPVVREGGGAEVSQSGLRAPIDALRAAVAAIPNTSAHFPTRESYRDMGYAIKAAAGPEHEAEAFEIFSDWCARWEDGENEPSTVESDWRRMKPPYRRGASWLFEQAAELGGDGGRAAALAWFDDVEAAPLPDASPFDIAAEREAGANAVPPLVAGQIDPAKLAELPPRRWLYGFKALRGYVTFIASPGGVGKTAYIIAAALAMATGQRLLHDDVRGGRALRCWIYNLEDDLAEMQRRLAAAHRHYQLPDSAWGNLRLNSGRDRGLKIVRLDGTGQFVVLPDYELLCAEIKREGIDVLFVDPFLRSHGVPENANEAQDEVMRLYAQVAERTGCAIVLVHHTKKGAIAGDLDSMRGGSAQGGGARVVLTLSAMTPEEAERLGIAERDRRRFVRLDDAKGNMAPAGKAEWLKLESVSLNNGTPDYPEGDSVQVAAVWSPPGAMDGMDIDDESAALDRICAGMDDGERYSVRPQDVDRWAGTLLIDRYGRSPEQAREILATWQKHGLIEVRDYQSGKQRRPRKGIFPARPARQNSEAASVFD